MTSTTDLDATAVLAAAHRFRADAAAAEVGVFQQAVTWCELHRVTDDWDAATVRETGLPIAGSGAPLVAEFSIVDFGACLGVSTDSARTYLAHALEIAHRLPLVYARVVAGDLPVWRARRIADLTIALSPEAAAHVDAQVAAFAHKIGPAATERLVDEAVLEFEPEVAAERAEQAADGRHLTISHDHAAGTGVSSIYGTLATVDAIDLDEALIRGAEALKAGGSEDSLDVRRAVALGDLARGHDSLDLPPSRDVTLYVHLDPTSDLVTVENAGKQLITRSTLSEWISTGDAKVTVKPVIDLNKPDASDSYVIPDRIREHVILRDPACVFPWCNRPSRRTDIDHIDPYDAGGPTSTENLAPLCRRHHRLKTFTTWTYTMADPGEYLWRSPHGYTYLRDRGGTRDVTPRPVEPPGQHGGIFTGFPTSAAEPPEAR